MKKQMLTLFLGMVVAVMADNYTIDSTNFTTKHNLVVSDRQALLPELGSQVLPSMPDSIEPGYLYLRKKNDAQSYSWYQGKPDGKVLPRLHAFRDATLDNQLFISQKFYGTLNAKAFQDEAEIYFDENFVYSSRVSTLYYFRDGVWQELKAQDAQLGSLIVETAEPCSVAINGRFMGLTPLHLTGVMAGVHSINLWAPGYINLITGAVVVHAKQTTKVIEMIPLDSVSDYEPIFPVTMEDVLGAELLEQLEPWWDQLQVNQAIYQQYLQQKKNDFDAIYPPVLSPPPFIPLGDLGYARYLENFHQTRDEAYGQYLSVTVGDNKEHEEIFTYANMRKDSLEADTLISRVLVDAQRIESDVLYLKLYDLKSRMDFTWSTKFNPEVFTDSVLTLLQDSTAWTYLQVKYENKPAMLIDSTQNRFRKNYRYLDMYLITETSADTLHGVFLLPNYLLELQEVQDWLAAQSPRPEPKPIEPIPVVAPAPDTVVQDVIPEKYIAPEFWVQLYRNKVIEIPGGNFRYKGKLVQMSPFALHSTEVTQAHFQRLMLKNPAKKFVGADLPAHSVNWHEAQAFCQEIGGVLPTEAQWEYAARAGSESGLEWEQFKGQEQNAADFAVYLADPKNKEQGPSPVGSKKPNAWGLYDMSANVAEWTLDNDSWFSFYVQSKDPTGAWMGNDKVFKGGSWQSKVEQLDLKNKDYEDPRYWGTKLGFRCAFPSNQTLNTDQFKAKLMAKDSLAMSQGLQLLGRNLQQLIDKIPE